MMAQGDFTKEEVAYVEKAVGEIFDAVSKGKQMGLIGKLNSVYLFLSSAGKVAPSEKK